MDGSYPALPLALQQLYETTNVFDYLEVILASIAGLFSTNLAAVSVVRLPEGHIASVYDRAFDLNRELAPFFERYVHEHPLIAIPPLADAHAASEMIGMNAFHQTNIYKYVFKQMNAQDQIAIPFAISSNFTAALVVNFSDEVLPEQLSLAKILRPHLARAFALALLQESQSPASQMAGIILADDRGHIVYVSPAADRLLLTHDLAIGIAEPAGRTLGTWLRTIDTGSVAETPLVWNDLNVEILRSELPSDSTIIRITSREQSELSKLVKVLHLVAEGDTDHEIAAKLGYSSRTISKMLERLYHVKGLRNRAAASAWFVRTWGVG